MDVGWVYHPFFKHHRTGPSHPERPERLDAILAGLGKEGILDALRPLPFGPATPEDLALVHEPAYVDLVRLACREGFATIGDRDTHLSRESYDVAALAAGGVLAACDAVAEGRVRRAFCAVRPPGHHAGRDRAMGFCLFNHVALGGEHLVRRRGFRRVAIVDFDVHHGNGTWEIFGGREDVLYVSLHEHPLSLGYPGTGLRGLRSGERDRSLSIYIPYGGSRFAYARALAEEALPALRAFEPEILLLSAGFDAHRAESIAHINLAPEDFGWLTRELVRASGDPCRGRVVSVLEGGYELPGLSRCVTEHVRALLEAG